MVKTYDVLALQDDKAARLDLQGTVSMDEAGVISFTATPGNEAKMAELMDEPIPVRDSSSEARGRVTHVPKSGETEKPSELRTVTRQSDPQVWFDALPGQYHGTTLRIVPTTMA
jgi:hypothetical protein